jgi:hypothetical protein
MAVTMRNTLRGVVGSLLLSSAVACGGSSGSPFEGSSQLHVDSLDALEVTVAAGGAPDPCPAAAGSAIGFDYTVDFAAGTLHVDDTIACAAPGADHAVKDVALSAADRDTLLSLANAMVFEKTPQCGVDGATTTLTIRPSSGASEQWPVDGQGGACTVGVTAIRGAEFNAFYDQVSTLAQ